MEGFPLGAPANAALYGTRRTARYLSLEARVAEAVSSAHGEVPDAKPRQTEVCDWDFLGIMWLHRAVRPCCHCVP